MQRPPMPPPMIATCRGSWVVVVGDMLLFIYMDRLLNR